MSAKRSQVLLLALACGVVAQPTVGCDPVGDDGPVEGAVDVLNDVGPRVIVPALVRFEASLDDMEAAAEAWSEAGGAGAEREAVRLAFAVSSDIWQELEVMQVGPAASTAMGTDPGAADLRDEIYSWPTVNPCRVDQETVRQDFRDAGFFDANLVNTYGLDALEHLLYAGDANACPGQVDINSEGTWEALGPDGVAAHRADYALALVANLRSVAASLHEAWDPARGDFGRLLASGDGSPYDSAQDSLNALFDALFYLEAFTQDRKLAEPLGMRDCSEGCAELAEGIPSGRSTRWILANLRGFRAMFTGGEGQGFDDLLVKLGHGEVADRILRNTDEAIARADAIGQPIHELARLDVAEGEALLEAIRLVTEDVEGDLATILALRLPLSAAGDND